MEEKTLQFIKEELGKAKNPVCLCSFGKDSLVLLHLILRIKKIPIVFWRESHFQRKFLHAQKIMADWDLEVYDYPPTSVDYFQNDDYFEILNFYWVNNTNRIALTGGIRKYKNTDREYLCAIKDWLLRPKVPNYEFKWDYIFHGHKECDDIHITKNIKLNDVFVMDNKKMVLPLKDWTDDDIWDYIKKHNLPYDKERYDKNNEEVNPDKFPTCYDCLDYKTYGQMVYCPKIKEMVKSSGKRYEDSVELKKMFSSYLNNSEV